MVQTRERLLAVIIETAEPEDGGVTDLTGQPVEKSRHWIKNLVELNEPTV